MSQHHDPVHPDSGHLTPEMLADLDEGLLDLESATHAEAHLTHCQPCRRLHALVSDVSAVLGDLPDETMPGDVWRGLQESLERAPKAATTVVPLDAARSRRSGWAGRALSGVAVAAGVLFVGALILPGFLETSGDDASTADGAPSAADEAADQSEPVNLAKYDVTRTGTQYQTARLDSQVTELVAARSLKAGGESSYGTADGENPAPDSPAPTVASTAPESTLGSDVAAARSSLLFSADAARLCLQDHLYAPDLEPLAIDIGLWKGQRAAVVVLPVATDVTKLEVWIIDPSCADNPEGAVKVWLYKTVDAS